MGSVGEAGGASEVEFAGCVEYDAVADDDGVDVGVAGELGEDAGGDLDGDGELGDGAVVVGCVGVDDGHVLGSAGPGVVGVVEEELGDGVGGEVALLLDGVGGAVRPGRLRRKGSGQWRRCVRRCVRR